MLCEEGGDSARWSDTGYKYDVKAMSALTVDGPAFSGNLTGVALSLASESVSPSASTDALLKQRTVGGSLVSGTVLLD